jgi:hypothetical protein
LPFGSHSYTSGNKRGEDSVGEEKNGNKRNIEKGERMVKGSSWCVWNLNANTGTHTSTSLATTHTKKCGGAKEKDRRRGMNTHLEGMRGKER